MNTRQSKSFLNLNQNLIKILCGFTCFIKFGLSGKHSKFEQNLPHGFDKSNGLLSKLQNHEEDFFKLCVLLKKSKLYKNVTAFFWYRAF